MAQKEASEFPDSWGALISRQWATCFEIGFVPKGPGTVASVVAWLFWCTLLAVQTPPLMLIFLLLFFFFTGVIASKAYDIYSKKDDASEIVVDEWVGMGIALCFAPPSALYWAGAFLAFRIFDISKPPGVRFFDKKHDGGWSVMLDDVVAGFYSCLILWIVFGIQHFFL